MATHRQAGGRTEKDELGAKISPQNSSTQDTIYPVEKDSSLFKKEGITTVDSAPDIESGHIEEDGSENYEPAETAKDLITEVIHVEDDPSLNPWTFRMWFLGIGLSTFGGCLATIYYFKPQTALVSQVFLAVVSYVIGQFMAKVIPTTGWIGRLFNPHPFNVKEHAAIIVMSSAAANAPLAIEVLAVQKLWYNKVPNAAVGIFLIFSSQCLGYGIAGLLRKTLVYPTTMLYPGNLPVNSLLETLHSHKHKVANSKRLRLFYWAFFVLFVYEVLPEYIMPILTGVSIFCLADQHNMVITNIFGGTSANEGLGLLSFCFDWQNIGGGYSPMALPLQTIVATFVGFILSYAVFIGVYYNNVWRAKDFPFLSQLLFTDQSNGTYYAQYNQTAILGPNNKIDPVLLANQGLPWLSTTFAVYVLATNLATTATFAHLLLWNYQDMKSGWGFARWSNLKRLFQPKSWDLRFWRSSTTNPSDDTETDPHYRLMLAYKDAPDWWYGAVLLLSVLCGLITIYLSGSTLPWWSFFVANGLAAVCILFFGAQYAITGFNFNMQPVIQMIGGYLQTGNPVANMYFVLFGYNSVYQAQLLLKDLKFAQYAHLRPRVTFTVQMVGTIVGSVFAYIMMTSITNNQREILLSIEGTNVWSGQTIQTYNTQAIAWGGLAKDLFSVGGRYQWVTLSFLFGFVVPLPFYFLHKWFPRWRFDYWNTAIIAYNIGILEIGINSSTLTYSIVGFASQWYVRKYRPSFFIKYNYILSAAMDGGTQVLVFILTFAVFGGAGRSVPFPPYWGNNQQTGNYDYCMSDPASSG